MPRYHVLKVLGRRCFALAGGLLALAVLGISVLPAAAAAPSTFAAATDFATGSAPTSVAAADLNGDGMPDLTGANAGSNTVSVLRNITSPGATVPTFDPAANFATGSEPYSVAVADLNGDGRPDLAVANYVSNTVSVLLNATSPGAAPAFAAATNLAADNGPTSVAAADLNGDGRPDLATANCFSDTVSVLLNTTTPGATALTFATAVSLTTGTNPWSVAVADLNGDGMPDLATANSYDDTVSVLRNTTLPGAAAPTFAAAVHLATGDAPYSVAVADLNGDGKPDLAAANWVSNTVSVLLNTTPMGAAPPTFATKADLAVSWGPYSVAIADLNGDGRPDLTVANLGSNTVSVLLNITSPGATTPTFASAANFATDNGPYSVAAADLNGDGMPDLAVTNSGSGNVSVLLNTTAPGATAPTFATQVPFAVGSAPYSVAAADLNGDGKPDLAVANSSSNTVSVLRNTTTPGAAPAFATKADFVAGNEPYSVTAADLNGDGRPDLATANQSGTASVLLNTTAPGATPAFATRADFSVGSYPRFVAAADLNGDGRPDLAVANAGSDNVSVLLNTTTASLALAKTASPARAYPGQAITYTLAFTNTNLFTATGVMITDTLPISLTGVSVASNATITDTGAVPAHVWQVQDLAPGAGGVITITGVLSSPLPPGIFTNTATINAFGMESHGAEAGVTVEAPEAAFSSAAYSAAEDAGQVVITVTLSDAALAPATVQYATGDHSATAGSDYIAASGVVTFAIGETSQTFTVTITDDSVDEADETVELTLSSPSNAALGSPSSAILTIYDNDSAGVVVTPTSLTVAEPAGNSSFNVRLTSEPTATVTIDLASSDATECTVPASVSLTAANWQTGVTVTVSAIDDMVNDDSQVCTVQTSASSSDSHYNAIAVDDVAVTVTDNDSAGVVVTPTSLTITGPTGSAVFTITLTSQPAATVTVPLTTSTDECSVPAAVDILPVQWQAGVAVTVHGVDDGPAGPQLCLVQLLPLVSDDGHYLGLDPDDVMVTVIDKYEIFLPVILKAK